MFWLCLPRLTASLQPALPVSLRNSPLFLLSAAVNQHHRMKAKGEGLENIPEKEDMRAVENAEGEEEDAGIDRPKPAVEKLDAIAACASVIV
jgi:hypothetical protein